MQNSVKILLYSTLLKELDFVNKIMCNQIIIEVLNYVDQGQFAIVYYIESSNILLQNTLKTS